MNKPLVTIIDDDQEVTASLSWLIESVGYEVKSYAAIEPFLTSLAADIPHCVILDIRMPVMSGFELQDILKTKQINIPIIFITGHGDIPMAVHAMKEGAINFLIKPINNQILLETINKAVRQSLNQRQQQEKTAHIVQRLKRLTPREYQVMGLMVKGKLTKMIADELKISQSTVELHRSKVMKKMEVASFAELVSLAVKYETIFKNLENDLALPKNMGTAPLY